MASLLFSERDEITLLRGLRKFWKRHEVKNDWDKFHQFMRQKFGDKYTKSQIYEKIRRIRRKFKKNFLENKFGTLGDHEARLYKLSELLWGNDFDTKISPDIENSSSEKGKTVGTYDNSDDVEHNNNPVVDISAEKANIKICEKGKRVISNDNNEDLEHEIVNKKKYVPKGELLNPADYPRLRIFFGDTSLPQDTRTSWTLIGSEAAQKLEEDWQILNQKEHELSREIDQFKALVSQLVLGQTKRD